MIALWWYIVCFAFCKFDGIFCTWMVLISIHGIKFYILNHKSLSYIFQLMHYCTWNGIFPWNVSVNFVNCMCLYMLLLWVHIVNSETVRPLYKKLNYNITHDITIANVGYRSDYKLTKDITSPSLWSLTSYVQLLEARNGYVISSHMFLDMQLLIHAGFKLNHAWKRGVFWVRNKVIAFLLSYRTVSYVLYSTVAKRSWHFQLACNPVDF